jgi:GT2 family glycosyltransferase
MAMSANDFKHRIDRIFRFTLRRMTGQDSAYLWLRHGVRTLLWAAVAFRRPPPIRPLPSNGWRYKHVFFKRIPPDREREAIGGLVFPEHRDPLVSIVIPVYNNARLLLECLYSLQRHQENRVPFEIIIADDASRETNVGLASTIRGVRYIRNRENLGYIRNCNQAAALARAPFTAFVNSDVIILGPWLGPFIDLLDGDSSIGAAGPMLLYDDGSLQESGAMLDADLRPSRIGHLDYPDRPEYFAPMPVDYCSGACLFTRRSVFEAVGGFSEYLSGAYWDDVDYALKLKQIGSAVWRLPKVRVLHHENASYVSAKRTKMIENNYRILLEKWRTGQAEPILARP